MRSVHLFFTVLMSAFTFCASALAGTIAGSIQFSGTAPKPEVLSMNADPTCFAAHSEPVLSESVVVNSNGTLKNVFVYVKEGLEGQSFEVPQEFVVLDQNGCRYSPHVLGAQVGQAVQIINSDATLHNVHSLAENNKQFNLGMPIQGMKLKKKFSVSEVMVKVKCDVHPWMNAYVGVLEHPYFSVSGNDGTFQISNLPAGDYVLEVWHETYGTQTQSVTVGDGEVNADFAFSG
jgi:plastocyanin